MTEVADERSVAIRRADRPGDLGWIVMAHGELYSEQFDWNSEFEALVAEIVADFAAGHDAKREGAWLAEVDGARVGCVMLVQGDEPETAKLRVLLVTPEGRGLRLGTRLVQECIAFARCAGYERMSLWTNDVLTSARKVYVSFGFELSHENEHRRFGHDLVEQTWTLDLRHAPDVGAEPTG